VHEFSVGLRLVAPEVVVDVDDGEVEVELGPEFEKGVEEAEGVGASGDGDAQLVARLEHGVAGDRLADLVEEGHGALRFTLSGG
jgi:hypothetical protein